MAGKLRYWKEKDGRFYARVAVPAQLRPFLDRPRSELIEALGADRRAAIRLHPAALARLQHELMLAERKANAGKSTPAEARFPMAPAQIAASHYAQRLALDDELRNDIRHSFGYVDELLVQRLRDGMAGKLTDQELVDLVGTRIERFRLQGNFDAATGSDEWRQIARSLCVAEYEALSRMAERDEGDVTGRPEHPIPCT